MTEMCDVIFYTTYAGAFLCDGKMLAIKHCVLKVALLLKRTSYPIACHKLVRYRIELAFAT
jgi:hypothetical protein